MRQWLVCLGLLSLTTSGCTTCADPHDCKFAAYGGGRQRTDMVHGRVASVFDPAPEINRFAQDKLPPYVPEEAPNEADDGALEEGALESNLDDGSDGTGAPDNSGSGDSRSDSTGNDLPGVDGEGSIELPDLEGDDELPDLPSTEGLEDNRPDSLRSARRNPLSDLFDAEL